MVGVTVGFALADEKPPGPDQEYPVTPTDGFAVNVAVPVLHIGPLFVGAAVGLLTTTVVV